MKTRKAFAFKRACMFLPMIVIGYTSAWLISTYILGASFAFFGGIGLVGGVWVGYGMGYADGEYEGESA